MKKIFSVIATALMLQASTALHAQVLGYGSGIEPDPMLSTGVLYTDDVRQKVTTVDPSLLFITVPSTTGFNAGDKVMIIQMKGGVQVGTHEAIDVASVTPTNINFTGPLFHSTYSTTGTDIVQVIRIHQYSNFTMTGGVVTCHPWNLTAGTGGILCMMVQGTLMINGGFFTVSGKGYTPEGFIPAPGGTPGAGSTNIGLGGAPGNGTIAGAGGGYNPCNSAALCGTDVGLLIDGFDGADGEKCMTCTGAAGTASTGSYVSYGTPLINTVVMMGSAGYAPVGYGSGKGADGGGAGGGGGSTASGVSGMNGDPGNNGGPGGGAGTGGNGGGIIYIKAGNLINGMAGTTIFYADGGEGDAGDPGGLGGAGGQGGLGGQGVCDAVNKYHSGGTGGSGIPGNGGDGGDGSQGGYCGTIWIVTLAPNPLVASDISVNGGASGVGAPGGYASLTANCSAEQPIDLSLCTADINPCGGVTPTLYKTCNCEEAFKRLALATSAVMTATDYEFYDIGGNLVATYQHTGYPLLTGYDMIGTTPIYYYCNLYDKLNCDLIFKNIYTGNTSYGPGTITLGLNHTYTTTSPFTLLYVDDNTMPLVTYMEYSPADRYIVDYTTAGGPKRCYEATCNPWSPGSDLAAPDPFKGNPGKTPPATPGGTVGAGNRQAHAPLPTPGSGILSGWKKNPTSVTDIYADEFGMKIKPNPVVNELVAEFNLETNANLQVALIDITGKKVYQSPYQATKGENALKIDMSALPAGTYILHTMGASKVSMIKVVKQ